MANNQKQEKLKKELDSFQNMWPGGYYEGDPLNPLSKSTYNIIGYISVLHAVYLTCIKPYVKEGTVALEIGPGRGAWSKTMLQAQEFWCMDALSAEHNGFWDYIGPADHVQYFQVDDFSCSMLPDNHFDYFFTFGTLCHISFDGISEYMKNLYPKLKSGAHCFAMVADYEKFNRAIDNKENLNIINVLKPKNKIKRWLWSLQWKVTKKYGVPPKYDLENEDDTPRPGRWYHAGVERTCRMLEEHGYQVLDSDVGAVPRDPIIHFVKP